MHIAKKNSNNGIKESFMCGALLWSSYLLHVAWAAQTRQSNKLETLTSGDHLVLMGIPAKLTTAFEP